jgi:Xaa-Pro aminopeptidase
MSPWFVCIYGHCTLLTLTHKQCPIHKSLIDVGLLDTSEKAWVDSYHREVLEKVSPLLAHDARALEWLKRETCPL